MYGVKPVERERQRIGLVKLERIPRLGHNVNADDLEARAVVSHPSAALAAE